jgi:hypothetical protein
VRPNRVKASGGSPWRTLLWITLGRPMMEVAGCGRSPATECASGEWSSSSGCVAHASPLRAPPRSFAVVRFPVMRLAGRALAVVRFAVVRLAGASAAEGAQPLLQNVLGQSPRERQNFPRERRSCDRANCPAIWMENKTDPRPRQIEHGPPSVTDPAPWGELATPLQGPRAAQSRPAGQAALRR